MIVVNGCKAILNTSIKMLQPRLAALLLVLALPLCSAAAKTRKAPRQRQPDKAASLPITPVAQIRDLPMSVAATHPPVRVRGVVTYYDRQGYAMGDKLVPLMFIQDASAGIFIRLPYSPNLRLKQGDLVEITGVAGSGDFAPLIRGKLVTKIGTAPLPLAPRATPIDLFGGRLDSQYAELHGVIRSEQHPLAYPGFKGIMQLFHGKTPRQTLFTLVTGGVPVTLRMHPGLGDLSGLVDAEITVRGVVGSLFNAQHQWHGTQLFVEQASDVHVLVAGNPHPFRTPVSPIIKLMQFSPAGPPEHRVHIRGIVSVSGDATYMQDQTSGIELQGITTPLHPGDEIDAVGYLEAGSFSPVLGDSIARVIRTGATLAPLPLDLGHLAENQYDSRLVATHATLMGEVVQQNVVYLDLSSNGKPIRATLTLAPRQSVPRFHRGSLLAITGVLHIETKLDNEISSLRLLLRSPADVVVLQQSRASILRTIAGWTTALLLILLLASLWPLNRKLRDQRRALRQLQQQQELILHCADDGLIGIDLHGVITFANPAAARFLQRPGQTMVGQSLASVVEPLDSNQQPYEAGQWPVQKTLSTKQSEHVQFESFRRRDGSRFAAEYDSTPIRDDAGALLGAVVSFRDVSRRFEVDQLKAEFVSLVSHELRTPLTSIRGALGLLASGRLGTLPEQGQKMLEVAANNTERLVKLVNDILDFERLQAGKLQMQVVDADSSSLVRTAVDSMLGLALKNSVQVKSEVDGFGLRVDPDRMQQVLANLMSNAIKFSPPSSTVLVQARLVEGEAEFRVIDHGRGIPGHMLEKVFERFQQVDGSDAKEKGGTGLGLPICRSIVQQHGGRIWAESEFGQGSTFIVRIPTASAYSARA